MTTFLYVVCIGLGFSAGWHTKGLYARKLRARIERMQRRLRGL